MQLPSKGLVSENPFIEILKDALQTGLTGMVRMEHGPVIKVVYFNKGIISFASSNEKADKLTEVLKRAGKLTPEQVEDAQARLRPNISLGKTLVELGYISAKDLLWGARAQVESILHQLLFWNAGNFQILEGSLPKEIVNLNLQVPRVIFDGIQKTQDRQWILQYIDSPEAVYALLSNFDNQNEALKLPVERIASALDGKRSLQDVAELLNLEAFETCKAIVALQLLGMAARVREQPHQLLLEHQAEPVEEPGHEEAGEAPDEAVPLVEQQENVAADHHEQKVSLGEVLQIPTVEELKQGEEPSGPTQAEEPELPDTPEPEAKPLMEADLSVQKLQEFRVPMEGIAEEEDQISPIQPESRTGKIWILSLGLLLLLVLGGWYYTHRWIPSTSPATPPPVQFNSTNTVVDVPQPAEPVPQPAATAAVETSTPLGKLRSGDVQQAAASWKDELQEQKSRYTIQLVIACETKTILDAFHVLQDSQELAVVPLHYQGRSCYRVIYGLYPSTEAAQRAMAELPPVFLNQASPATPIPVNRILK